MKAAGPNSPGPTTAPGYLGSDDALAEFAGMVTYLDKLIGQVLDRLDKLGIADNTIVFFTSDNGPQPGLWTDVFVDFFDGNGPFKGAKTNFYEGGIRTPMLVRWPGKIKAGSEERIRRLLRRRDADAGRAGRRDAVSAEADRRHLVRADAAGSCRPAEDARISVLGSGRARSKTPSSRRSAGATGKRSATRRPISSSSTI